MNRSGDKAFLILNILVPILIGAAVYCVLSPEVIIVQRIAALFDGTHCFRGATWVMPGKAGRMIRNYLPDVMWGYALIFVLFSVLGSHTEDLVKIFAAAALFSAMMELLQLTPAVEGTFDLFDIVAEVFAEAAAALIINGYVCFRRHRHGGKGKT